jgi:hypothetical protein
MKEFPARQREVFRIKTVMCHVFETRRGYVTLSPIGHPNGGRRVSLSLTGRPGRPFEICSMAQ